MTDCVSLDRQKYLESHGEEHWERLFFDLCSDWRDVLDCPTRILIGDGSSLAHPTDIFVRVNVSDMDMVLHSGNPGLRSPSIFHHRMREMWHLFGLLSDVPEFLDTVDPVCCVMMPKSRHNFSNVSMTVL